MKSPVLDALLDSPALPELIQEAQRALDREKRLREKFYASITPEQKWEFIQGEVIAHSPALSRHLPATKRIYDLMSAFVRVNQLGVEGEISSEVIPGFRLPVSAIFDEEANLAALRALLEVR